MKDYIILLVILVVSLVISSFLFINYQSKVSDVDVSTPSSTSSDTYVDLYYDIDNPNIILVKNASGGFEEWQQ